MIGEGWKIRELGVSLITSANLHSATMSACQEGNQKLQIARNLKQTANFTSENLFKFKSKTNCVISWYFFKVKQNYVLTNFPKASKKKSAAKYPNLQWASAPKILFHALHVQKAKLGSCTECILISFSFLPNGHVR